MCVKGLKGSPFGFQDRCCYLLKYGTFEEVQAWITKTGEEMFHKTAFFWQRLASFELNWCLS